MFFNTIPQSV